MKNNNPFNLMFGKAPYSIIERYSQYQEIINTFNMNNPTTYAILLLVLEDLVKLYYFEK